MKAWKMNVDFFRKIEKLLILHEVKILLAGAFLIDKMYVKSLDGQFLTNLLPG